MKPRLALPFLLLLIVALACNMPQRTSYATATLAAATAVISASPALTRPASPTAAVQPSSAVTEGPQAGVELNPCDLLPVGEAYTLLGEEINPAYVTGGACVYPSVQGVHALSVFALPVGSQPLKEFWSPRLYLLGMLGMPIDQATEAEIRDLDAAGRNQDILLKLAGLAAGSQSFTSRSIDGLGDAAWWVWKDLSAYGNNSRQAFLIWVRPGYVAGIDILHGEAYDEPTAFDRVSQTALKIDAGIPPRFHLLLPPPTPAPTFPPTATPMPRPTLTPSG